MLNNLVQSIRLTLISLAGVVISLVLTRMSGDPTSLLLPVDATAEARAALRARLGRFGVNPVMRDILSRMIYGARMTLFIRVGAGGDWHAPRSHGGLFR